MSPLWCFRPTDRVLIPEQTNFAKGIRLGDHLEPLNTYEVAGVITADLLDWMLRSTTE